MIAAAREGHPTRSVRRRCTLRGVNRAWYYAPQRDALAAREEETRLRDAIERLVLAFPGYGYRRVTQALQRDGWDSNHQRVLRVMRQEALRCQRKRRFVATTDARHACRTYPHLLQPLAVDRLDQAWGHCQLKSGRGAGAYFEACCSGRISVVSPWRGCRRRPARWRSVPGGSHDRWRLVSRWRRGRKWSAMGP